MSKSWLISGCLLLGLFVCARPAAANTVFVSIQDFLYSPKLKTILLGDSVVWTNDGNATHTATSDSIPAAASSWDTGFLGHGDQFGHRFNLLGVYRYHCLVHGASVMTGRIVVITSNPVQNTSWGQLKSLYRGRGGRVSAPGRARLATNTLVAPKRM